MYPLPYKQSRGLRSRLCGCMTVRSKLVGGQIFLAHLIVHSLTVCHYFKLWLRAVFHLHLAVTYIYTHSKRRRVRAAPTVCSRLACADSALKGGGCGSRCWSTESPTSSASRRRSRPSAGYSGHSVTWWRSTSTRLTSTLVKVQVLCCCCLCRGADYV